MRLRLFFLTLLIMISSSVTFAQTATEFHFRGEARFERKEYAAAIEDFTQAIKLRPDFSKSLMFRGFALEVLGELERAIADFTKAMEIEPLAGVPYSARARVRLTKGDSDGAIADFTKAIELDPKEANKALYYRMRSDAYRLIGKVTLAAADKETADKLDKKDELQYGSWFNQDDTLMLRFFAGGAVSLDDIDKEDPVKGNYSRTGASVSMTFENGIRASATIKENKISVRFTYTNGSTRDTVLTQE